MASLQESLIRFKKQLEKCQSTLTSIEAKNSNDTERLQHINSIRKDPVRAQIKRVIDLLFETRQAFTPEQINEACHVDVNGNKAVFYSLRNSLKVSYDGKRFAYDSENAPKDKNQLLVLIQKFPDGIAIVDLKDAYPTVMEDLQSLKATGQIWLLSNFDSQEDIAYPNELRVPIKVDDEIKQLFHAIKLPRDMIDIERYLQRMGITPATNTAKRRAMAQLYRPEESRGPRPPQTPPRVEPWLRSTAKRRAVDPLQTVPRGEPRLRSAALDPSPSQRRRSSK